MNTIQIVEEAAVLALADSLQPVLRGVPEYKPEIGS